MGIIYGKVVKEFTCLDQYLYIALPKITLSLLSNWKEHRAMPHFGLMDEGKMQPLDAELLRAQLHTRCGRRRMNEGKYPEGISTMFDAVLSGMRWFALKNEAIHEEIHKLGVYLLEDDLKLQQLLAKNGAWPHDIDFGKIQDTVYLALEGNLEGLDPTQFLWQVEGVLTKLGVIPFDEKELPPEDPDTF